jgi:hypothetical protein
MMTLFPFKEMCIADTDKFTAVTRNRKKENICHTIKKIPLRGFELAA